METIAVKDSDGSTAEKQCVWMRFVLQWQPGMHRLHELIIEALLFVEVQLQYTISSLPANSANTNDNSDTIDEATLAPKTNIQPATPQQKASRFAVKLVADSYVQVKVIYLCEEVCYIVYVQVDLLARVEFISKFHAASRDNSEPLTVPGQLHAFLTQLQQVNQPVSWCR